MVGEHSSTMLIVQGLVSDGGIAFLYHVSSTRIGEQLGESITQQC